MSLIRCITTWMTLFVGARLLQRATAFGVRPFRLSRGFRVGSTSLFSKVSPLDGDKLAKMQKECSKAAAVEKVSTSLEQYLQHQKTVFDDMSGFFGSDEATPPELVPVIRYMTDRIVKQMKQSREKGVRVRNERNITGIAAEQIPEDFQLLDVGCGVGVLFPYLVESANDLGIRLNITGLDLSSKMIELARKRAEKVVDEFGGGHEVNVVNREFVKSVLGEDYVDGDGIENEETAPYRGKFDGVVTNACFGNFFDTEALMTALTQCLRLDGVMFVTHPLGADFVRNLHKEDPTTVPHHLPTISEFRTLTTARPLQELDFIEKVDLLDNDDNANSFDIYFASAARTVHRPLKEIVRLRGPVDSGFGRGGKKLGFPTANLPSSLFANALESVPTGVYFGWAFIEGEEELRNIQHRAVVNVGYSPTFDGEENKEKIVEAHLMLEDDEKISDFYNETMRLSLIGFLRPEMKFPSFPDLVAAINNDVFCAKDALEVEPFASLRSDTLFNAMEETGHVWVGQNGGDDIASWEFQDMTVAIEATADQ